MSASATIGSIITFLQSIGISLNFNIKWPHWIQSFFDIFTDVSAFFLNFFDSRYLLLIMMVVIPGLIDIFANLISESALTLFLHLIDLGVIAAVTLLTGFLSGLTAFYYGSFGCLAYLLLRLFFMIKNYKKHKEFSVETIMRDIIKHYIGKINPNFSEITSIDKYHNYLIKLNVHQKPFSRKTAGLLIAFDLLIVILVITLCTTVGTITLPSTICTLLFFMFITILYFFNSGRKTFHILSNFCKHWGLRLIFFGIEIIYIPVTRFIFRFYIPYHFSCGEGKYLVNPLKGLFVGTQRQLIGCYNCTINLNTSLCMQLCDGHFEKRVRNDIGLEYHDDIIIEFMYCLVYGTFVIVVGVPLLWSIYIKKNKKLLQTIPIYGDTIEKKWEHLVMMFSTNGIFFFDCYKMNNSFWTVWYFALRFMLNLIIELSQSVNKFILVALTVIYILQVVVLIKRKPYLSNFNTIVDIVFFVLNAIFTIIPLLVLCGVEIGNSATISVFALVVAIPGIVPIFVRFINNRKMKSNKKYRKRIFYDEGNEEDDQYEDNLKRMAKLKLDLSKSIETQWQQKLYPNVVDESVDIVEGKIKSIEDVLKNNGIIDDTKLLCTASRHRTIKMLRKMYNTLDRIIDNYTISELAMIMRCVIDIGFLILMFFTVRGIINHSGSDVDVWPCSDPVY
ncbi:hypothetical protein TRFO_24865 [Tritrichomonas foetus]|uniref:Uncharacterized protein n=1 Tax=Tritrichomonas foetus TaxID=1144522 RepID=A0A1J4KBA7_9EUKA|nr:hypothetical protein TRFO_24865 [Tritrichomonas foetus]|eukprot:OHT06982.1 hypothetical protein TRFO_24865 [Tritrichomonas foetus]